MLTAIRAFGETLNRRSDSDQPEQGSPGDAADCRFDRAIYLAEGAEGGRLTSASSTGTSIGDHRVSCSLGRNSRSRVPALDDPALGGKQQGVR